MKTIVIGAGRGLRMMPETQSIPKCLIEGINGQRVLDWILDSLKCAGINDVVFVGGYQIKKVMQAYPQMQFYENINWPDNNVLASLMVAEREMDMGFMASYSDILYGSRIVKQLIGHNAEIALVVDKSWRSRYIGRTLKGEDQAEKVIIENGQIVEIGRHIPADRADGEFIGLAKFSQQAACKMRNRYHEICASDGKGPFQTAPSIHEAYLTDMIQELIDLGIQVNPIETSGDWAELDTVQDLEWARARLNGRGESGLAQEFWAVRAAGYQRLDWTSRKGYLDSFVAAGEFQPDDLVLDVGTGTGIVAHAIAPLVSKVVGIDISPDMRKHAVTTSASNEVFEDGDARSLHFPDSFFDKVTARMIFHHLMDGGNQAIVECFRVLKPNGLMILSEGVPPDKSLRDWYTAMFALKEERLTFFEEDLVSLLQGGGFCVERVIEHITPQVSIGNWLRNSGLPETKQNMIMQLHLDLDEKGKQYYNMQIRENDILCDFKFLILVGRKPLS